MNDDSYKAAPFRLGDWIVDPVERTLTGPNGAVHLEPKVMDVLVVLAQDAGRVVLREAILEQVWPRAVTGDEVLSRSIYQLRKQFGDSPQAARYIVTVPKRGYRLAVRPEPLSPGVEAAPSERRLRPRWPLVWAATGLVAAVAMLLVDRATHPVDEAPGATTSEASHPPARQGPGPTIAVLPFTDLSAGRDQEYFGDGLAEELLNGLGRVESLNVIARASSFAFRDTQVTAQEIGRRLDVDALLTGSIRIEDERVRVVTRLIDVADGRQLWSERFDGRLDDIFAIQDQIARGVVATLEIELAEDIADLNLKRATLDARAYALYLEGRYYANRRQPGALEQAIAFFEQAVDVDPRFALAYCGLADARMLLNQYGGLGLDVATSRAQHAVDQAFALDPLLADAFASQGLIHMHNGRFDEAATALREAAAINPANVTAHLWLGRTLDLQMEYQQALAAYRRARQLDPLAPIVNMNVGRMLMMAGRLDESREHFELALEHNPDFANVHWAMGFNSHLAGDLDDAREFFEAAFRAGLTDPLAYGSYAVLLVDAGDLDAAERWLRRIEALDAESGASIFARSQLFKARDALEDMRDYGLKRHAAAPDQAAFLFMAAAAETLRGDHDAAIALYDRGLALPYGREILFHPWGVVQGSLSALNLAYAYQQDGRDQQFEAVLAEIDQTIADARTKGIATPPAHYVAAILHSLEGRPEAAIEELSTAIERGWPGAWCAAKDPKLAPLRSDDRFQRLIRLSSGAPAAATSRERRQ